MDEFSAVLGTEFHFTRGTSELKNSSAVFESQAPMAQRSPCALFVQVDHLPHTVLGPLGGIVKKKKRRICHQNTYDQLSRAISGTSLVVQWLRLHPPSAGAWVPSLARNEIPYATTKEPTCLN